MYVHELPPEGRRLAGRADVLVAGTRPDGAAGGAVGLLEAPARVNLPLQALERAAFLEVRDRHSRELVALVELLSPSK